MIRKIIKEGKEALVMKWLNSKIEDYGAITELEIDTSNKLVKAELLLKGETAAYKICLCNYELQKVEDSTFVFIERITAGREWLDLLIQNYIEEILPEKKN
jgi:hypothetical protein